MFMLEYLIKLNGQFFWLLLENNLPVKYYLIIHLHFGLVSSQKWWGSLVGLKMKPDRALLGANTILP